jgi:hypothetical protein
VTAIANTSTNHPLLLASTLEQRRRREQKSDTKMLAPEQASRNRFSFKKHKTNHNAGRVIALQRFCEFELSR